ncbi:hypothetical protein F5Y18DRAFT_80766 [Xylariaceae sp. FL1019]|nr:hypothetical protein F5Y18DRAFT_80766 [Xylariaceae sp. FL1019]
MKLLPTINISLLPLATASSITPRSFVKPAPCVGIAIKNILAPDGAGALEYQGFGVVGIDGSEPEYDAGSIDSYHPADVCGQTINGHVVTCHAGVDVTKQCFGYGYATYNGLDCRTICYDSDVHDPPDPLPCWRSDSGSENRRIVGVFICDKKM